LAPVETGTTIGAAAPVGGDSFVVQGRKEKATITAADGSPPLEWGVMYEVHGPDVFAFLRRSLGSTVLAEDLLQDTFLRAMRASTQPAAASVRPWLFRIAANLAVSHHRRSRLLAFLPFGDRASAAEDPADAASDHVRRALRSIPRDQAVTLALALHEGFTRREIAEMLAISEEGVKSRLARGRRNFAAAYRALESAT
jgi:RNA polymerase sigma-70 factor, ECF subfamily